MAIIGIDLGTTNSLACIYRDGKAELISPGHGMHQPDSAGGSGLPTGTVLAGEGA